MNQDIHKLASAYGHVAVTPHDTTLIDAPRKVTALYVGTGGDVVVVAKDGTVATYVGVPSGSYLWVQAVRVNATNTTASDILAVYGE